MHPTMYKDLGKGFAAITIAGAVVIGGAGFGASYLFEDDVTFDLNKSTRAGIEDGTVSADMICREITKGQNALAEEFARRGYDGPIVTYSMDDCLADQNARRAVAPPAP